MAYGLFDKKYDLRGVVTYGTPPSSSLKIGLAGAEFKNDILELNRLVLLDNKKNEASMLVGKSLQLLPDKKIIVSFADTEQDHVGRIYQATNFIYTGLSAKRKNWRIRGKEHLHGQTIADMVRGEEKRADALRRMYGDDFYLEERSRKHRYIFIKGPKKYRKDVLKSLNYPIEPYPKGPPKQTKPTIEGNEHIKNLDTDLLGF